VPGYGVNNAQRSVSPQSVCNLQYVVIQDLRSCLAGLGLSRCRTFVGRGAFSFRPGTRVTYVAQRVKLNDIGVANGELELWVDGCSVVKGLTLTRDRGVLMPDADFRRQRLVFGHWLEKQGRLLIRPFGCDYGGLVDKNLFFLPPHNNTLVAHTLAHLALAFPHDRSFPHS
jgi:hypothetical protein